VTLKIGVVEENQPYLILTETIGITLEKNGEISTSTLEKKKHLARIELSALFRAYSKSITNCFN